jgi:hypothetical protein
LLNKLKTVFANAQSREVMKKLKRTIVKDKDAAQLLEVVGGASVEK